MRMINENKSWAESPDLNGDGPFLFLLDRRHTD